MYYCTCSHPIQNHEKNGDFEVRGRCLTKEVWYDSDENEFVEEECGCPQFCKQSEVNIKMGELKQALKDFLKMVENYEEKHKY